MGRGFRVVPIVASCCALLGAASCNRRWYAIEAVTATQGSRVWFAGTEGLAGYYELAYDDFQYHRVDYPLGRDDFRGAYATFSGIAAARVVVHDGETYLFTRRAELLRWEGDRWQPSSFVLPEQVRSHPQLDEVLRTPDGRLLVQLHPDLLLWASPHQLRSGQYVTETTPTYFLRLAFVGEGVLYGIGHDDSGNVPVLRRRDEMGRWPVVAVLPTRINVSSFHGIVDVGGGVPAVVATCGLYVLHDGELLLSTTSERLRRTGFAVSDGPADGNSLTRVIPVSGGSTLLAVTGADEGFLGQHGGQEVFWPCELAPDTVAAFVLHSRTWVVTRRGAIVELVSGGCRSAHRAILDE